MFKTATIPATRSGRFGNETPHPTLRRSVSKPTGDCSANYSHEAYITAIRRTDDINNIESEGRYCFAAIVMPRRTDDINNIESEGRYCFAAIVMPRRTDAINSIESEGRYDERTPACDRVHSSRTDADTYEILPQEDTATTRCVLLSFSAPAPTTNHNLT